MRVYLDDVRPIPSGWHGARWPAEVIDMIQNCSVEELSLDHDLGDTALAEQENRKERTGYDVLLWIEEQVATTVFIPPPVIHVHSSNGPGVAKMQAAITQIKRLVSLRDS